MKVKDIENFDSLLEDAENNSITEWEMEFVTDVQGKYFQYGENTRISELQLTVLERIASQV